MQANELKRNREVRVSDDRPGRCNECGDMRGRVGETVMVGWPTRDMAIVRWDGCPRGHVFKAEEIEYAEGAER